MSPMSAQSPKKAAHTDHDEDAIASSERVGSAPTGVQTSEP